MNLFQIATRGIDLDSAPITPDDESPREGFRFEEPAQPQQRLRLPAELDEVFALAAQEYEIDPDVLRGIAYAESRFNPDIISGKVKSKAGAIGLMQFMPETAKEYGIEPTDPTQAIIGAAAYLRKSLDKFGGDYERAVASYNWGPNRKAYDSEDWTSKAPAETQKYLQTVFSAAGRFKDGQAERGLPQGVTPSKAGAGRGVVNPTLDAPVTDTGDETARLAARYKAPRIERTYGEAVSDTGAQLVEGVNNILGAPASLVAPDSGMAQFFKGNADTARDWQSDAIKQRTASASAAIDKAGEDGIIAQMLEAAKQYSTDPALAARFVVTNLPSMIPGIGAAKLAQVASLARGATLAQAAATATTVAGGMNAVLNAGGARGEAFEDIKATLIKQGIPEAQAIQQALKDSLLPAAVGGVAGFVSGKTGLEGAIVGKAGAKAALTAGAKSAAVELGGEQFEEVAPKLATNYQAAQYDNRSMGKDVGRTIVETAIGSGPGSLYSGVQAGFNTRSAPTVESQPTTPQVPPTVAPAAPVTPDTTKTQAVDNIAAAIKELEGGTTQAATVQPGQQTADTGTAPVAQWPADTTEGLAPAGEAAVAGQPESTQSLSVPEKGSAQNLSVESTPTATPLTESMLVARQMADRKGLTEGIHTQLSGGKSIAQTTKLMRKSLDEVGIPRDQQLTFVHHVGKTLASQPIASQPQEQPAQQTAAPAPAKKPRTKPQPLLNDTEAAMLADFERMYQADVKGEIKTRLGLMPARQDEATAPIVQRKPSELLAAIKRAGGIKSTNAGDLMGGSAMDANRILPGLFTKGGMNLDLLVPFLKERGYMTQADEDSIKDNGGVNKLAEILQAELSGARAQTMDSTAGFESNAEAAMRSELDSKAFALGLPMKVTNEMSTERLNGVINRIERKLGKPVNTDFATRKMSRTEAMAERQAILMADRVERARAQYDADIQAFAESDDRIQDALLDVITDADGNPVVVAERDVDSETAAMQMVGQWSDQNGQKTATTQDSGASANTREAGAPDTTRASQSAGNPEADRTETGAGEEGIRRSVAPAARYEVGNSLNRAQRRDVLKSLTDVYVAKGAPKEFKGQGRDGNERTGYAYSPELFEKSDITGAMVRYYVTLPDGRIAHPTELFPDYTDSDIKSEMERRANAEKREAENIKSLEERVARNTKPTKQAAAISFYQRNPSVQDDLSGGPALAFMEKDGGFYATTVDDVGTISRMEKLGWTDTSKALTTYTPEEVTARQQATAQAEAATKRAEDAATRAEAAAKQASEIAQRSVAAADTFELGGNAEDNLTGQEGLKFSRASENRAARAALARIMEKGVTSPDDLRDLLRVPGYSKWAKSAIAGDVAGAASLRRELQDAFPGSDWKAPKLIDQGIITIYPDWVGLTSQSLDKLTKLADKYDTPIGVRGGAATKQLVSRLDGFGFELYNGLQERADRMPNVMFGMIRPAGGITATTPLFSQGDKSPRTPISTITQAIAKAYGNLLNRLEGKGLVTLTQTEEEAIAAAAQARADQNGGDVEVIKAQLRASVLASQRAWHGTPHRGIEKFSTDKIGTGEGAQAFGWGLYFADRREIADHYRNALSQVGYDTPSGRALTRKYLSDEYGYSARASNFIISALDDNNGDVSQAIKDLTGERSLDGRVGSIRYRELDQAIGLLVNFAGRQLKKSKGQLYEVDIPEDSDMLLWDKPLSEQPEPAKVSAKTLRGDIAQDWLGDELERLNADWNELTGQELYKLVQRALVADALLPNAGSAAEQALLDGATDKATSLLLADDGIKGIKYLDGTSRNAGEGSYNYVVFSGEDVQIVDVKYSKDGNLEGFFDPATGKSFLIADNLTAESAPATLMHEVGIHRAAEGGGKMGAVIERAGGILRIERNNEFVQRVQSRMDEAGETSNEEAAAYIVTEYEKDRTNAPASVKQWIKDFIADVRAWLFNKGVLLKADQLTVADIAAVARANANRMARGENAKMDGERKFSKTSGGIPGLRDVRKPKENLSEVGSAMSTSFKVLGNRDVPMDSLTGAMSTSVSDAGRAQKLADTLKQEGSYFERVIVDDAGNVIEGQHRVAALRLLGAKTVPAVVIQDFMRDFDAAAVGKAMRAAQQMPSDRVNNLVANLAEIYADEKGDIAEVREYEPPRGFEKAWEAGIDALNSKQSMPDKRDQTETSEFKRWFAGSQVVDADGKPLVVYHGTNGQFNEFDLAKFGLTDAGWFGKGFYFTGNKKVARQYGEVMAVYLRIEKPMPEDMAGFSTKEIQSIIEKIKTLDQKFSPRDWLADDVTDGRSALDQLENMYRAGAEPSKVLQAVTDVTGFDGVVSKGIYIAFNPTQIKSATGNSGQFDPKNPDIRRSVAGGSTSPTGAPTASWDAPIESKWDDHVFQLQDKNIDLKRVTQAITEYSGKLANDINVYLQEELYHGRTAKRVQEFTRMELEPALKQLARQGMQLSDLEEYMHARHAKEANRVIAERNPTQEMIDAARVKARDEVERLQAEYDDAAPGDKKAAKDALRAAKDEQKRWRNAAAFKGTEEERQMLSGMSNAAADAYFAKLSASDKMKLDAVAKRFDAIMDETSRLMVAYELESQDTIDSWGKMYQHYIPLQREDKEDSNGRGIGQGFSIKGRETKGRTGSTRKVVDIVANIAAAREKTVVRGEKNRVAQALVGLVTAHPNQDFWKVGPPEYERVFNPSTGKVENRVSPTYKSLPNVVVAKVAKGGMVKEVAVTFEEDNARAVRMAGALKNLDTPQVEGWLGTVAKMTRYFSSINTQYNPVFGVVNLVRDVQGAMINLQTTEIADKKAQVASDAIRALSGIYGDIRATRNGGVASSAWSTLYEQFQEDGGQTGFRNLFETTADRTSEMNDLIDPEAWAKSGVGKFFSANGQLTKPLTKAKGGFGVVMDWLSDYNEAMENGVRLAAYKAALDKGMTRPQAASLAKNLTVNFNRKGQSGAQAGAVYAFFNASMQGTARLGQVLFTMEPGKPKTLRLSPLGKKVVYGGVLLGSLQALALSAGGFGDDEPPDFVRERSLIIPTGDKTYVNIPMPLGLHVIPNIGRIATEFALSGFKNPAQRMASLAGLFADSFNPIGNAGLSMQTIAPTVLDPLVALTENKDWTGKPISRVSSNKDLPGYTQHKDSASVVSKFLAEAINTLSGGNQYVAGVLSPTPDQIDYLAGQLGGGVWRELSKVEQTATNTVTGEETPLYKIPLVGRFVGSAAGQSGEGNAFHSNAAKLNRLETEIKGLMKDGKAEEAQALRASNPESRLIVGFNMAERRIQNLRKEKSDLIKSGAEAERVKDVEQRITAVMSGMNKQMATATGLETAQ